MVEKIFQSIRQELNALADPKTRDSMDHFFKEGIKAYGVKTPLVGKLAQKYWKEIKAWEKPKIFTLCEALYASDFMEEAFIVGFWGTHFKAFIEKSDFSLYEKWIKKYINNWAKCDGFCNHAVGDFLVKFPNKIPMLFDWARSQNRWLRRAAAVSLIVPAKKGLFLKESFTICDILLSDPDDLVQKGYGWLLKEQSRKHEREIFTYVCNNRRIMPRTALRYAIERMPAAKRAQAMAKA